VLQARGASFAPPFRAAPASGAAAALARIGSRARNANVGVQAFDLKKTLTIFSALKIHL